jgi:hypothetical protein
MRQNLVNFLMLRFLRHPNDPAIHLLLIEQRDGGALQIWVHPEWERLTDASDQGFLSGLMEDWKAMDGRRHRCFSANWSAKHKAH